MDLVADALTMVGRLRDVRVGLSPGRLTAICGPNGAGKSTLLSALAGLEQPDGGHVLLGQHRLAELTARERAIAIGYLPQAGEVAWNVTVETLVRLGRLPHRTPMRIDAAATMAALQALDLTGLAGREVGTLSGGERARALLARVLAGQPRWILADEPLAALDLAHQQALLAHFRRLAGQGVGVVVVLHDLALAMNHADHVIVLDRGTVAANGAPHLALAEGVLAGVWGVKARWVGDGRTRALAIG
ncbi:MULTISPECIES: ABC transporter ATP-binding protein [unclassified Novosphingobium]|uniref:ABC transporter ATP-binding protein n=1 Tax=unclassified Novosphingobium TaxID=2644732 RepID=UPI000D2F48F8|nr:MULTISPECIES: ABC transporter ATP-binding protein [unclassified Novosphingobium]PTR12309.1 iron complex transport system ATP-binding protein [Novosphingobium sp. GV055]PUB05710.1 iron complex transport system ATP-binding protein [Novosphingobium sp. GV061]PUB21943.1 iron complex transport system ATP-binding protein [Novosphingobium sp. GV079]PUB43716.1 iron complex transport system ATP-binding protein [Novosphingobium sp. GV027]